jgi:alkylation response protein AidB-like acyl-CoA dehydrogenase
MIPYTPPLADMRLALEALAGLDEIAGFPGFEHATPDTVDAVLDEAAKFARDVIAPLNSVGDREGSRLEAGIVHTPTGFRDAYLAYVEGGWNGLPFAEDWGGQNLPAALSLAVLEMWTSASLAFSLGPMLTVGAIESLIHHGSAEQKRLYLPKLVSGEWTGTMNLTEPQAGSDVGALRTKAVPEGDHWRITGQKIYITYGDQDYTDNVIHLVLARTPDSPPGTRGISLFLVPKVLVGDDGSLGEPNDLRVVSLEHKLGIHASPTCVMSYGDEGGAIGYLIGAENRGMEYMFTMMNSARLNVGLQGVAISERAYQQARDFAKSRVQGKPGAAPQTASPAPIVWHPDVRRMLLAMKSRTEASRALAYFTAGSIDRAKHGPIDGRAAAQGLVDLLIPIVKAWSTDLGVENASLAVQVHGGMGFIEETGVAQHLRDARIAPIYEGTNGIQALDLLGRKIGRDGGAAARSFIDLMRALEGEHPRLQAALNALETAVGRLVDMLATNPASASGVAVPFLEMMAVTAGGWALAREAEVAKRRIADGIGDPGFNEAKRLTARFYAEQYLSGVPAKLATLESAATIFAADPENL